MPRGRPSPPGHPALRSRPDRAMVRPSHSVRGPMERGRENPGRPGTSHVRRRVLPLLLCLTLSACWTRVLTMPPLETVPAAAGQTLELAAVVDRRPGGVLGKVDTLTIASGADMVPYVEGELVNTLSRMGFAPLQVEHTAPLAGRKRVLASLTDATLSSESTLLYPVAASIRLRIEVVDESGKSTFRKEFRGAETRDLGRHKQGGPEDAQLLADVVAQACASLARDESFVSAVASSREKAGSPRVAAEEAREIAPEPARGTSPAAASVSGRLKTLDRLLEEGLIDQDDYFRKRKEILDEL